MSIDLKKPSRAARIAGRIADRVNVLQREGIACGWTFRFSTADGTQQGHGVIGVSRHVYPSTVSITVPYLLSTSVTAADVMALAGSELDPSYIEQLAELLLAGIRQDRADRKPRINYIHPSRPARQGRS